LQEFIYQLTDAVLAIALAEFLCYLPVRGGLRFPLWRTVVILFLTTSVYSVMLVWLGLVFGTGANLFLLASLPLVFFIYHKTVLYDPLKKLFVFLSAAALTSISVLLGTFVFRLIFGISGESAWDAFDYRYLLTCAAVSYATGLLCLPLFGTHLRNAINNVTGKKIWRFLWILPLLFILLDISVVATPSSNFLVDLNVTLLLTVLFFASNFILMWVIQESRKNEYLFQENRIAKMQEHRYLELRQHIDQTRAARHDFRQQLHVIQSYAEKGKLQALQDYLHSYVSSLPAELPPYCNNIATDAVVRHYAEQAQSMGARLQAKIDLPARLPVKESDFCIVIGNLLENAVNACGSVREEDRFLSVHIYTREQRMIAAVIENSFCPDKPHAAAGEGIGLLSVDSIVRRYSGRVLIKKTETTFIVHIYMSSPGESEK